MNKIWVGGLKMRDRKKEDQKEQWSENTGLENAGPRHLSDSISMSKVVTTQHCYCMVY